MPKKINFNFLKNWVNHTAYFIYEKKLICEVFDVSSSSKLPKINFSNIDFSYAFFSLANEDLLNEKFWVFFFYATDTKLI